MKAVFEIDGLRQRRSDGNWKRTAIGVLIAWVSWMGTSAGKGGLVPVAADLEVVRGGAVRKSFSGIPAAERYVHVINGTPGLNWLCLRVNGQLFVLKSLMGAQNVMVDVGAAMGAGDTNVVALCGQGAAGAGASITIGDVSEDNLTSALRPSGSEAQCWSSLAEGCENPVLQISLSGEDVVLSWPDIWNGRAVVQACSSLEPQAKWQSLPLTPVLANGWFTVTVRASSPMLFRLNLPE